MTGDNPEGKQATDWLEQARQVMSIEADALNLVRESLDEAFVRAIACILEHNGRLVVLGMGKSGIIAKKIAATFASTGTPAFFVHAAEARHGDLGMITDHDVVLALSHSGETEEVSSLLPTIKRLGASLIAITGNPSSTLGRYADIVLPVPIRQEACPMNLAPTASTTAALALGDALAVVTLKQRGIDERDFARVHPAGSLGRRLMRVADVMHKGSELPTVDRQSCLREAIMTMSSFRLGITGVMDSGRLVGCLSDGDLRRILQSGQVNLDMPVIEVMHSKPHVIEEERLATEAVRMMEEYKITVLFVVDKVGQVVGAVHMHDLLHAGAA